MRSLPAIVPAIIIVVLVGTVMFKPLIARDPVAGYIMLGIVVLAGLIVLIGGLSHRRSNRYYRNRNRRNY